MADCCAPKNNNNGRYDVAVIGAGSAGFSAAITAAEQGARVALIGHGTIGGTCVNVGCVPSKTLIRAAEAVHGLSALRRFAGLDGNVQVNDWATLIAQKDDLVSTLRQAKYADLLPHYDGITYLEGQARLEPEGVQVNGSLLKVGKTIITTGARASAPPIPGIETVPYLTSTTALALKMLPESLLIIGGGVIGCELGQMFARFGVQVTICCRSRLLPEMEPEISEALKQYLEAEGIEVCTGIGYQKLEQTPEGVALSCESLNCDQDGACDTVAAEHVITAEKLLVATGRRPNTDGMGLEDLGVTLARNGGIAVDDYLQTSVPGIYAAGDVTGRDQFVYMAAYGAKLAARNATGGNSHRYDNSTMPAVVFTDPQVASVGLTEAQAHQAEYEVKVSLLQLNQVPRALAARDTRGLIKLIADAASDKLIGAHLIAPEGADTIQTASLAIKYGMTTADLGATIFPYLGAQGVFLQRKGQGLVLAKGERFAKLSQMGKGVRLTELEDRFGERFDVFMAERMKDLARDDAPEAQIPGYENMTPAEQRRARKLREAQLAVERKNADAVLEVDAAVLDYNYWKGVEAVYRAGERRISRLERDRGWLKKTLPNYEAREKASEAQFNQSLFDIFRNPEKAAERWLKLEQTFGVADAERMVKKNANLLGRMNGARYLGADTEARGNAKRAFRKLHLKRRRWREQQLKLGHHRDRIEANRRALRIALNDFAMLRLRADVPFELREIMKEKAMRRAKALTRATDKAILASNLAEDRKMELLRARRTYMERKRERERDRDYNRTQGLDYLDW